MTADERDLAWIVERVRSHYDATAIYLFGSHAKETPRPGSDIDLLIIGRSRLPRLRRGREVAAALAAFPARFDLLFFTEPELTEATADPLSFMSTVMASARALHGARPGPPRSSTSGARAADGSTATTTAGRQ